MKRIFLLIYIIFVGILLGITLDYALVCYTGTKPVLAIKEVLNNKMIVYKALFYNAYVCTDIDGNSTITIAGKSYNFDCNSSSVLDEFVIEDESNVCAMALEDIYVDENYVYSLSCMKSSLVYVKFASGDKVLLKEALNKGLVKSDKVIEKGFNLYKKNTTSLEGTIKEIKDNFLLVNTTLGDVSVSIYNASLYKENDKVNIYYDGNVLETYPSLINLAYVKVLDN